VRGLAANPLGPITNPIGNLIGGAVSASTNAVLDGLAKWVANGAANLLGSLTKALDAQTSPNLGAGWFGGEYVKMLAIAGLLALPLVCGAAVTSIVRQDAGPLVRAVLVHLPLAAVGTGVAINMTTLALAATDNLCSVISSSTGNDTHVLFDQLATTLDKGLPGAGGFGVMLVAVLVALGAFVLTLELIVRSAATYVAMLFLPVALVGLIWPATARWGKRVAEMITALILSKFVVVAILSLAVGALRGGIQGSMSGLLTGAALLLLACMSPFALLRMVPIIEAGAIAHLDGVGRQVASAPIQAQQQVSQINRILDQVRSGPPHGEGSSGGDPLPVESTRRAIGPDGTQVPETGSAPTAGGAGGPLPGGGGGALPGGGGALPGGGGAAGGGAAGGGAAAGGSAGGGAAAGTGAAAGATEAAAVAAGPEVAIPVLVGAAAKRGVDATVNRMSTDTEEFM
jgi:hypothetical protein